MSNRRTARTPVHHTDHRTDPKEPAMPDYDFLPEDLRDDLDAEHAATTDAFIRGLRGYEARP